MIVAYQLILKRMNYFLLSLPLKALLIVNDIPFRTVYTHKKKNPATIQFLCFNEVKLVASTKLNLIALTQLRHFLLK